MAAGHGAAGEGGERAVLAEGSAGGAGRRRWGGLDHNGHQHCQLHAERHAHLRHTTHVSAHELLCMHMQLTSHQ